MIKVAITYSSQVGGSSVISLKKTFSHLKCDVVDADYRKLMDDISSNKFENLYKTIHGRRQLFLHAKFKAKEFLKDFDCLVLSGNSAMIDPELFNAERDGTKKYDFSRTVMELALIHVAIQCGMPIFGVCGGHQVVAVYHGSSIKNLDFDQIFKQKFMNYDPIVFTENSVIKNILESLKSKDEAYTHSFFGAHHQVVENVTDNFDATAFTKDKDFIEALESKYGAPIITTQFHPEVTIFGLPDWESIYSRNIDEVNKVLKIFEEIVRAGQAYKNKKSCLNEIKTGHLTKVSFKKNSETNEEHIHFFIKCFNHVIRLASIFYDFIKSIIRTVVSIFVISRHNPQNKKYSDSKSFVPNQSFQESNHSASIERHELVYNRCPQDLLINCTAKQFIP